MNKPISLIERTENDEIHIFKNIWICPYCKYTATKKRSYQCHIKSIYHKMNEELGKIEPIDMVKVHKDNEARREKLYPKKKILQDVSMIIDILNL